MPEDVTEFSELDPNEMHLVGRGATGFPFLLAKAADDAVYEELVAKAVDEVDVVKACGITECEVCACAASKAKLDAEARHSLSDGDFAYIDSKGGRHLPIHDKAHVRNALARFNQTHFESDEAKAKAHSKIVARAKELGVEVSDDTQKADVSTDESLSQTREVGGAPEAHDPNAGDGGEARSVSFPHNTAGDGGGDTAPDKDLQRAEAGSQTAGAQTNKAEGGEQPFVAMDNSAADTAEKDATSAAGGSHEGAEHTNQPVSKEEIDMDHDELKKVLDERDEQLTARVLDAIKADRKERKAKRAKKAEKAAAAAGEGTATETAKGAEEASKAAEGEGATETVEERLVKAEELLAKMAGEDGKSVTINGAGVVAMLRGTPEQRDSVFKQLDERVEEAEKSGDPDRIRTARFQRTAAKMVAQENARERGEMPRSSRFGPNTTELFSRTGTLAEDADIHGV